MEKVKNRLSDLGEFELINLFAKDTQLSKSVIKGIGDDTAVVKTSKDKDALLTTDMLIEGVHFTKHMSASGIGHKALAASVSDIAAMGGEPLYALISLGVNPQDNSHFVQEVYKGIKQCAKKYNVHIVGGDTVKSQKMIINVALMGEVKKNNSVTRAGAKKGDIIFVTGQLGNSFTSGHHLTFTPRVAEAQFLVKHYKPTAMIDISDGLASDLSHIMEKSKVGATLFEDKLPLRDKAEVINALIDGEDFELAFTLKPKMAEKLRKQKKLKHTFYEIGHITSKKGLTLVGRDGNVSSVKCKGFTHF